MSEKVAFLDLGLHPYQESWDLQEKLMQELIDQKTVAPQDGVVKPHTLLFVEHPHVYTLGKSGDSQNLLLNNVQLKEKGVSFYKTNRGGDITYHGPGQLVGYPIFDLERFGIGLRQYIYNLEEVIILSLRHWGIESGRDDSATGVWLGSGTPQARKICAIGVRSSRFVTMHGFAFNINTDLNFFRYINPCGILDKGVTSLSKELGREVSMEEVKQVVLSKFEEVFGASMNSGTQN